MKTANFNQTIEEKAESIAIKVLDEIFSEANDLLPNKIDVIVEDPEKIEKVQGIIYNKILMSVSKRLA